MATIKTDKEVVAKSKTNKIIGKIIIVLITTMGPILGSYELGKTPPIQSVINNNTVNNYYK
jgi:hypothetical protein